MSSPAAQMVSCCKGHGALYTSLEGPLELTTAKVLHQLSTLSVEVHNLPLPLPQLLSSMFTALIGSSVRAAGRAQVAGGDSFLQAGLRLLSGAHNLSSCSNRNNFQDGAHRGFSSKHGGYTVVDHQYDAIVVAGMWLQITLH